jgi:hypothetical protein
MQGLAVGTLLLVWLAVCSAVVLDVRIVGDQTNRTLRFDPFYLNASKRLLVPSFWCLLS